MNRKEIFNYLMDNFNKKAIEYVILHSYQELPEIFESDIDMAIRVSNIKGAIKLLDDLLQGTGWRVIQYWRHEYYAVDCVISNDKEFLQVDFCTHYERDGRLLISVEELLSNRRKYNNFYVPSYTVEFIYILIKKILKKNFSERSKLHLYNILHNMNDMDIKKLKCSLRKYLNDNSIEDIISLINLNNFDDIEIDKLYKEIRKNTSNLKANIKYVIFDIGRIAERIINPTGLFIVLLGVDGSGKTTISNQIMDNYVTAFRTIKHYHSRVRVFKDISQIKSNNKTIDISNPHSKNKSSGKFISIVKFIYYYLDYMIGNLSITRSKIKSSLVLMERYYFDYYIDNIRYNLNLSNRFLKFFEKFIKKPDVIFILTGDGEILLERKHEITLEEIEKQKNKLNNNFNKRKNAYFINTTSLNIDECVCEIISICNEIMRGRRKW